MSLFEKVIKYAQIRTVLQGRRVWSVECGALMFDAGAAQTRSGRSGMGGRPRSGTCWTGKRRSRGRTTSCTPCSEPRT
eukprot:1179667-Prorocentrum_minimum.AAC.2